jgi:hypothetical protein
LLLLIKHDDSLKGISENGNFQRADGTTDDPFAKYILGNSESEMEIKELLSLYEDLLKTELPGVTQS